MAEKILRIQVRDASGRWKNGRWESVRSGDVVRVWEKKGWSKPVMAVTGYDKKVRGLEVEELKS